MLNVRPLDVATADAAQLKLRHKILASESSGDSSISPHTDAPDLATSVRCLHTTWHAPLQLRHPTTRLLMCTAQVLLCFWLSVTSPLAASLQSPATFPVYGSWLARVTASSAQVVGVHVALTLAIAIIVRSTLYRWLVQNQWNSVHSKTGKLTSMVKAVTCGTQTARCAVWTGATASGSWTFVALVTPVVWAAVVWALESVLHATQTMLYKDGDDGIMAVTQLQWHNALYQTLMSLHVLVLLLTLDSLLQDQTYTRVFYGQWGQHARAMYVKFPWLRIALCWLSLGALIGLGLGFQGFTWLRWQWSALHMGSGSDHTLLLSPWLLPNESCRAMFSGILVVLDLLWFAQAWDFPAFSTAVGVRAYGLAIDNINVGFSRFRLVFSSKWIACFVVMALLLPLESCQLYQELTYSPSEYGQTTANATARIVPTAVTLEDNSTLLLHPTDLQLLDHGALSRYIGLPKLDSVPPVVAIVAGIAALLLWLWRKEQCVIKLSRLDQYQQLQSVREVNALVNKRTRHTLHRQILVRDLYTQRRSLDARCASLAVVSVLLVVLQIHTIWRGQQLDSTSAFEAPGETYGCLLLLVTLALVVHMYRRYMVKMELLVLRNELPAACNGALSKSPRRLLLPCLVELILCAACLPPFLHGTFSFQETRYSLTSAAVSMSGGKLVCPDKTVEDSASTCVLSYSYPLEIINMCAFLRLYVCIRLVRNSLLQQTITEQVLMASGTAHEVPVDSLRWSIRVAFSLNPTRLLILFFLVLWIGTATALSIFEHPMPSLLDSEERSLWLTIVTMSTVGYGDSFPVTALGRFTIFAGAVLGGSFLLALMTSVFLEALKGSTDEHKVVSAVERLQWQRAMAHASATLIASAWKAYRSPHKNGGTHLAISLLPLAHQFKILRKSKPKDTFATLESMYMHRMAHWRAVEWTESWSRTRADTNAALAVLEDQVTALERVMHYILN